MLIGLTGQIGSGKSTAARVLSELGAEVVDADLIGREVVERSPVLKRKLVRAFGPVIIDPKGRLRRKMLAALAFTGQKAHATLNALVHPYLLKELRRQVKALVRTKHTVVIDAALLLDWGMDREVDYVLVIHARRDLRLRRLKRKGMTLADAQARERAQLPLREFLSRADRTILNNGTVRDLERKVTLWYHRVIGQSD